MAASVKIKKIGNNGNSGINSEIEAPLTINPGYQYIVDDSLVVDAPIINNGKLIIN